MKKILALVVAFALCFTAVAGCITTSAEDAATTPEIKVSSIELANTAGATSFTVSGTNCSTIAAQKLAVTIEAGVEFTGIEGLTDAANVTNTDDADYYVETVNGNTVVTLVSVLNIGAANDSFTYTFNVTVPANETEADVIYNVTPAIVAGNIDEEYVTVNTTAGTITVKAPVAEEPGSFTVTFKDYDGTVLDTQVVTEGDAAVAPEAPVRDFYLFKEWDVDFSNVTSDLVVTATYSEPVATDNALSGTIIFGDTFGINFSYRHDRIGTTTPEDIYLYVEKATYTAPGVKGEPVPVVVHEYADNNFVVSGAARGFSFHYKGISAREMSSELTVRFYYVVDGVLYTSRTTTVSLARLAYLQMKSAAGKAATSDVDAKYLTTLVDMVNYGSEVQKYKNYNWNSALGDTDPNLPKNFVNTDGGKVSDYAEYATATTPTMQRDTQTSGDHLNGASMSMLTNLGNAVGLRVQVGMGTNELDLENTYFMYSYITATGVPSEEKKVYAKDWIEAVDANKDYSFIIEDLAIKDLRQPITFAFYNADGTPFTKVASASIIGYAAGQIGKGADEMWYSLAKLTDSATAYFLAKA